MREYNTEGPVDPERQDEAQNPTDQDAGRGLSLREWVLERLEDAQYFGRLLKLIGQNPPCTDPIPSLNKLVHAVLEDAIGLAIERHDFVDADEVCRDVWLALNGINTCEEMPIESLTALRNFVAGLVRDEEAVRADERQACLHDFQHLVKRATSQDFPESEQLRCFAIAVNEMSTKGLGTSKEPAE